MARMWIYKCSECDFIVHSKKRMKYLDYRKRIRMVGAECPDCKSGYIQDHSEPPENLPFICIKKEAKTLGLQAERNTQAMGHYEYEDRMAANKARVKKVSEEMLKASGGKNIDMPETPYLPWWRSGEHREFPKNPKPLSPKETEETAKKIGIGIKPVERTEKVSRKRRKNEK